MLVSVGVETAGVDAFAVVLAFS
eukprot:COSAG05_NODE_9294_length_634_cov_0.865421_2_plen_22_part_01